jgi:putative acetyltransferase
MAAVHVRSARRAYAEYIEPELLEHYDEAKVAERFREGFDEPNRRAWVWDQNGTLAGHAVLVDDDLRILYVDPVAQGAGVGTALLRHAEEHGARELRVLAENEAARAFYEHHGWVVDGEGDPWEGHPTVLYRKAGPASDGR